LRASHRRGERRSPYDGHPQDAPTIKTIVLLTFYEIINIQETEDPDKILTAKFRNAKEIR